MQKKVLQIIWLKNIFKAFVKDSVGCNGNPLSILSFLTVHSRIFTKQLTRNRCLFQVYTLIIVFYFPSLYCNFIIPSSFYKPHCKCQFCHPVSIRYHLTTFINSNVGLTTKIYLLSYAILAKFHHDLWVNYMELKLQLHTEVSQAKGLLTLEGGGRTALSLIVFGINWTLHEPIQVTNSRESWTAGGRGKEGLGSPSAKLVSRQTQQPKQPIQHVWQQCSCEQHLLSAIMRPFRSVPQKRSPRSPSTCQTLHQESKRKCLFLFS